MPVTQHLTLPRESITGEIIEMKSSSCAQFLVTKRALKTTVFISHVR